MKHLFDAWTDIRERIQKAQAFYLFLDYDGTLTPIVSQPDLALCPPEVKVLLQKVKDFSRVSVAIVSGRSVHDLYGLIGIPGITYVGNHGLEIQNPAGFHKKRLSLDRQRELAIIQKTLEEGLGDLPGVLMEDKESILAVHYRMVSKRDHPKVYQEMDEIRKKWGSRWDLKRGKMVFEIRPRVDFHKGKAVRDLLRIVPTGGLLPFYFGDDQTDEDAFCFLRGRGITVFVGAPEPSTNAEYFLNTPKEVAEILGRLIESLLDIGPVSP
ncbi:MAG TPA: trehalose-phosphatase [Thermodesulfobacteriota bacterium]